MRLACGNYRRNSWAAIQCAHKQSGETYDKQSQTDDSQGPRFKAMAARTNENCTGVWCSPAVHACVVGGAKAVGESRVCTYRWCSRFRGGHAKEAEEKTN